MRPLGYLATAILFTACSSPAPPPPATPEAPSSTPSTSSTPTAAPTADAAPSASAKADAAPAASSAAPAADGKIAPLKRPKSAWSVNGKSLSDIEELELLAEFEKAGLTKQAGIFSSPGNGYVALSFPITKGKMKGRFSLVRPAKEPTSKTSIMGPAGAAEYETSLGKSAATLDKDADVFFSIQLEEGGTPADAKKLLDSVIQQAK